MYDIYDKRIIYIYIYIIYISIYLYIYLSIYLPICIYIYIYIYIYWVGWWESPPPAKTFPIFPSPNFYSPTLLKKMSIYPPPKQQLSKYNPIKNSIFSCSHCYIYSCSHSYSPPLTNIWKNLYIYHTSRGWYRIFWGTTVVRRSDHD